MNVWFIGLQFASCKKFNIWDVILDCMMMVDFKYFEFRLIYCDDEFTGLFAREVMGFGKVFKLGISLNAELGFERTRCISPAGMKYARVMSGLFFPYAIIFFENDEGFMRIGLDEIIRGGKSDYTAAEYGYVDLFHSYIFRGWF